MKDILEMDQFNEIKFQNQSICSLFSKIMSNTLTPFQIFSNFFNE